MPEKRLQAALEELNAMPLEAPWESIELWATRLEPLIRRVFSDSLPSFKEATTRNHLNAPYGFSTSGPSDSPQERARKQADFQRRMEERRAKQAKLDAAQRGKIAALLQGILEAADFPARNVRESSSALVSVNVQGDRNQTAVASGQGAVASNTTSTITQADFKDAVKELQKAVIDNEDELGEAAYEYLTDILLKLRKIELRQESMAVMLAQTKETVDESWARGERDAVTQTTVKKGVQLIGKAVAGQAAKAIVGVITPG